MGTFSRSCRRGTGTCWRDSSTIEVGLVMVGLRRNSEPSNEVLTDSDIFMSCITHRKLSGFKRFSLLNPFTHLVST